MFDLECIPGASKIVVRGLGVQKFIHLGSAVVYNPVAGTQPELLGMPLPLVGTSK